MEGLPIKKVKPTKVGNSYYFLIPAQFISNGAIDINKEYNLDVIGTSRTAKPKGKKKNNPPPAH